MDKLNKIQLEQEENDAMMRELNLIAKAAVMVMRQQIRNSFEHQWEVLN